MSDEGKRERLIESAIKLFAAEGIAATSTNRIAREAGVAAGTLFNYFATKEELIRAAYIECKIEMAACMKSADSPGISFRDLLEQTWQSAIRWALEHPGRHEFMNQFARSPDLRDAKLEEQMGREMRFIRERIRAAQAAGEIVPLDVAYLESFFSACFDATVRYLRGLPVKQRGDLIAASFRMVWRSLATE